MLTIHIPGRDTLALNHLILDYNGTIALDGEILPGIAEQLKELSRLLTISVITADTHGTASDRCQALPVTVKSFPTEAVGNIKAEEVRRLTGGVCCIGNGYNDIMMFDASDLSICIIGPEGCCGTLLQHADVVVSSIHDALNLLLKPDRLRATIRT